MAPEAGASDPAEQERGGELMVALERGMVGCDDLEAEDFVAIGEFAIGRMLGSGEAHAAMDRGMAAMMGKRRVERMNELIGIRFAGCGERELPPGTMGMMEAMGAEMGDASRGAMDRALERGWMHGFERDRDRSRVPAWLFVLLLVVLAAAIATVALLLARPRGRTGGSEALDLLAERFARGEISPDEYVERRRLLEEGLR